MTVHLRVRGVSAAARPSLEATLAAHGLRAPWWGALAALVTGARWYVGRVRDAAEPDVKARAFRAAERAVPHGGEIDYRARGNGVTSFASRLRAGRTTSIEF